MTGPAGLRPRRQIPLDQSVEHNPPWLHTLSSRPTATEAPPWGH